MGVAQRVEGNWKRRRGDWKGGGEGGLEGGGARRRQPRDVPRVRRELQALAPLPSYLCRNGCVGESETGNLKLLGSTFKPF